MTTIAFDGKILATDSQQTLGDSIVSDQINKIITHKNTYLTGAGQVIGIRSIIRWIVNDCDGDFPDYPKADVFIVIQNQGYLLHSDGLLLYGSPKFASGSGQDYAFGILTSGGSAITAVEGAIKIDTSSGGKCLSVETTPHPSVQFSPTHDFLPTLDDLKSYFREYDEYYIKLGKKTEAKDQND